MVVVGLGGVGAYAAEALARAPVGHLVLIDPDRVELPDLNRQLLATHAALGQAKVEVMAARILAIRPETRVTALPLRLTADNVGECLAPPVDFVVDAIDDLIAKVALLRVCVEKSIPIVSAMGAGNKLDPSRIRIADIGETFQCPLARRVRQALRRSGIQTGVTVVFSDEPDASSGRSAAVEMQEGAATARHRTGPGTISYLPAIFGLTCAAAVIRGLLAAGAAPRTCQDPR